MGASMILVLSGATCVAISLFFIHKLRPREGQPPSVFLRSEGLSTSVAMGTFILLILGGTLIAKGVFS